MVITRTTRGCNAEAVGRVSSPLARESSSRRARGRTRVRGWPAAVLAAAIATSAPSAGAQTWRLSSSIGWESTLTDNADLSPDKRSDWVNQLTPGVTFQEKSARTQLTGAISLPILLYARTSESNQVYPQVSVNGSYEAVENFLFVEAFANVSQQFQTPFGARSTSLANATENRYTAQSYGVNPYIRGAMPGNVTYELRDNNTWSDSNASSIGNGRSYTNEIVGRLSHDPTPTGWALEYDRAEYFFAGQPERLSGRPDTEITEIARARGSRLVDPSVELSATVGYEDNRFFHADESGATYGAGIRWRPTDRTNLNANWEHRFFGSSYDVSFDHTTRLTVWSLRASRNITSYPQQLALLPQGGNVPGLLNALFASRITDPIQRQALVDQLIRDRGLPTTLTGPVPLLAQQITLVESESATVGLLGARNSIFFSVYRSKNEPLRGTEDILSSLALSNNDTQTGASAAWTHQLSPTLSLGTNLDWSRTTSNVEAGGTTRFYSLRAFLSTPLSPFTSVYGGARYQDSQSDVADSYREAAVYVGMTYTFH